MPDDGTEMRDDGTEELEQERHWGGLAWVGLVIMAVGIAAVAKLLGLGPFAPASFERALEKHSLYTAPELAALVRPGAKLEELGDLQRQAGFGLSRLEDPDLLAYAAVVMGALNKASTAGCAEFVRVRQVTAGTRPAFGKLRQQELDIYVDILLRAAMAEARGRPEPVRVTQDEMGPALDRMYERLGTEQSLRFNQAFASHRTNDEEVCWAVRTILKAVADAPEEDRAMLVRGLFQS